MKRLLVMFLVVGAAAAPAAAQESPRRMRVAVPVLDVRAEPTAAGPTLDRDPLQETQLLYGERVLVHEIRVGWARIEAVEQPEWTHHERWEGYPGWVDARGLAAADPSWIPTLVVTDAMALVHRRPHEDQAAILKLSLGTQLVASDQVGEWPHHLSAPPDGGAPQDGPSDRGQVVGWWRVALLDGHKGWIRRAQAARLSELAALAPELRRGRVCEAARQLLGTPYYWGGRSARVTGYRTPPHTAVDCSGLVNLCYRAAGVDIPRDAHEQSLRATPISPDALQPGDLIFFAGADNPSRVTHVMLYIGDGHVIEGPGTGQRVRETTLAARRRDAEREGRQVRYGTFLP